ncbi:hypothetical protein E4K72_00445 [Oxalobacteraceae bacterium OM1]|nr:hypothetical protein E4K72_00445 [Oxalobacteraceae bacterium OM1]
MTGRSNVTVKTVGGCGKATISPAYAVTGWTPYRGQIYVARVRFTPMQVAIDGVPAAVAHWPDAPQVWATSASAVPSSDLAGATLVYQENRSVIKAQQLNSNAVNTAKPFYLEGKLWMLDRPGEWAAHDDWLYVWTPDGASPEGRVWAAPGDSAINADLSANVTIDGIKVALGFHGISANKAVNLQVRNAEIAYSAQDGIWASGSNRLAVDRTTIVGARRNGIDGWYSVVDAVVTNTTVSDTGMVNLPSPSNAGIMFGGGANNRIDNVRVMNSAYHGIAVSHNRDTTVSNSVVDTACVRLTDCGGIYTSARDTVPLPLKMRIEGNTVVNVRGAEGIGIYLDDSANGVDVVGNTVARNTKGMMLHSAFDNVISNNRFESSAIMHIAFPQDVGTTIHGNVVTHNTFISTQGEQTFNMGPGANLKTFATFDANTYRGADPGVFAVTWDGKSNSVKHTYSQWRTWSGQDSHSTMNGAP